MSSRPLSYEAANALWDVLVREAGANEMEREFFVHEYLRPEAVVAEWPIRTLLWSATFRLDGVHPPHVRCPAEDAAAALTTRIAATNVALLAAARRFGIPGSKVNAT